eukprot:TRINITY_DN3429_c0_g1_i2.p1 TRINITY_DN3429_c0_g1~~TRINITY_DN3429_c0_g1_i2.p1  ORF type:complete len:134 (-),score=10.11 TRINITY_DN3429_c0_g1_i2:156-557(-)
MQFSTHTSMDPPEAHAADAVPGGGRGRGGGSTMALLVASTVSTAAAVGLVVVVALVVNVHVPHPYMVRSSLLFSTSPSPPRYRPLSRPFACYRPLSRPFACLLLASTSRRTRCSTRPKPSATVQASGGRGTPR